ncbi:MAG TPA: acyltransferase [Xanthobacteraceae bacterium]|nr:acyltransferase [Xanthobacteraceae bacterium]
MLRTGELPKLPSLREAAPRILRRRHNVDRASATRLATAGEIMERHQGTGPGFDAMRLALALTIFITHSFFVSQGDDLHLWHSPLRPLLVALVPVFFAVSGFLVTGSAIRTGSVAVFLIFRALRIVPALMTEVTLSALILGPLLTTLPLPEYFSSRAFFEYFGNIIGWVRFYLPGVFETNPMPYVNVNLWTLRPEFYSYALMTAMMLTGLVAKRRALTICFCALFVALTLVNFFDPSLSEGTDAYRPNVPIYYFLLGALAFHWRHRIVLDVRLFAASLALAYAALRYPGYAYLAAIPAVYCMIYLAMLPLPRLALLEMGDYSYGIYLYGFPIQQSLLFAFPVFRQSWPMLFSAAAPITIAFAMLSWHWIERPALRLKHVIAPKLPALSAGLGRQA